MTDLLPLINIPIHTCFYSKQYILFQFATVYKARDLVRDRIVAVKKVFPCFKLYFGNSKTMSLHSAEQFCLLAIFQYGRCSKISIL